MTDRKRQPAVLLRRIVRLEVHLEAERQRADKAWAAYADVLHQLVDAELRIKRAEAALRGDDE